MTTPCHPTIAGRLRLPLQIQDIIASLSAHGLEGALPVPSYSTLSRRAAEVALAVGAGPRSGPVHVVIDSRGFKV